MRLNVAFADVVGEFSKQCDQDGQRAAARGRNGDRRHDGTARGSHVCERCREISRDHRVGFLGPSDRHLVWDRIVSSCEMRDFQEGLT